jgi:hypothetical protein
MWTLGFMASTSSLCRIASHISDWPPHLQRNTAGFQPIMTVGRVHFMVIQIAACGCYVSGTRVT